MASREVTRVAGAAEDLKLRKYASLSSSYVFYPVCIETLGVCRGESGKARGPQDGCMCCENTGDHRATSFLVYTKTSSGCSEGKHSIIDGNTSFFQELGAIYYYYYIIICNFTTV